jgi:hypothetical protein
MCETCSTQSERRNAYKILVGKPDGKRPLGRLDVDGSFVLEWVFGKQSGKVWTGFINSE